MNNIKYGILAFGVLGVISFFIPMEGVTMFKVLNAFDKGSLYMVMGGFIVAAVMGGMALKAGIQRWQAIVAAIGFAIFFLKFRAQLGDVFKGPFAGKLMIISAIAGLVCAVLAAAKPEPAK